MASKTPAGREGDLASTAQEMLTSIRLVQSYGRGTARPGAVLRADRQEHAAALSGREHPGPVQLRDRVVEALAISAVVWLGVWLVDRDAITIGTLVLFVILLAEHVQAGPQDRQGVVQDRQGLRQRRTHRRPARPRARRDGPARRCRGAAAPRDGDASGRHASPTRSSTRTAPPRTSAPPVAAGRRLRGRSGRGGGPGRPQRCRQEHDRPAGPAAVRPGRRRGTGRRPADIRSLTLASLRSQVEPWCCRTRSCSAAAWRRTSPTASPTRRRRGSRPRPGWRTPTSSSPACPRATRRSSASGERRCPVGSASASRSPAPSSATPRS